MMASTWRRLSLSRIAAPSSLSCFGMQGGSSRAAAAPRVFKQHCAHRAISSAKPSDQATAIRPVLSNYEQALRKAAAQKPQDGAEEDSMLPRVKLERFLRRQRMFSANFIYQEKCDLPHLPTSEVICLVKAAGRGAEGKGQSRFDATQQACHQWLQDYQNLHTTDKRQMAKLRPKAREPLAIYAPPDAPWHDLPSDIKKLTAAKSPWLAPVPELEHGLASVLHNDNSKATPIWAKLGGKPASAYVRTIVQPKDINWSGIAPFTPPSFDDTLHALALKHKLKYKVWCMCVDMRVRRRVHPGLPLRISTCASRERFCAVLHVMCVCCDAPSRTHAQHTHVHTDSVTCTHEQASTSSITGLLSHMYQLISNFRPADTSQLSAVFKNEPNSFSYTIMKRPVVVILRPKDGVFGIDSQKDEKQDNKILMDLGKSMERMLTMPENEFKSLMLKPLHIKGKGESEEGSADEAVASVEAVDTVLGEMKSRPAGSAQEGGGGGAAAAAALAAATPDKFLLGAYNFSKLHSFMLRSQLDCIYGDKQIFDIKTRATHAIRNCEIYAYIYIYTYVCIRVCAYMHARAHTQLHTHKHTHTHTHTITHSLSLTHTHTHTHTRTHTH